jgi:endonuclease G
MKSICIGALLLTFSTCGNDDAPSEALYEAQWKISSTVSASAGSSAMLITAPTGSHWTAEITDGSNWCSFSTTGTTVTKDGTVTQGLNVLYVYYGANNGAAQRQAEITFHFDGRDSETFSIIQLAKSQEDLPSPVWPEIPDQVPNANFQYVTHYVSLDNHTVRNYSICFDKTRKASLWVAYPIHKAYTGGTGGRTDAWAFDPHITVALQADCVSRSYGGSYDRGHQIASADRVGNNEMNRQTFYMSNMTPQLNRLNQDMWARLETKVRSYQCSDTLYVVTGAYFGTGAGTTTDGAGTIVSVPTHYYKVLLRTVSGTSGKTVAACADSELKSIGFWVEHKSYGNIDPPSSICKSVADIEQLTGFTFFPQVSAAVKQQNIPSQWDIK